MPQSFTCLHYHLVFGTKHRTPAIPPALRPRLYDYIGGVLRSEGGVLVAAGGTADHVHLLVRLSQQRALADVLRVTKANASKWVHDEFPDAGWPGWQSGYGAFAVSYSGLEAVKAYLANQEAHHRRMTFEAEYRMLLGKHGIEFDARHLWE